MSKCPIGKCFDTSGKIHTIYCGQWSCVRCQKKLAQVWGMRTALFVEENGNVAYFWTLTLRGKYRTAVQGFTALPRLWDTFRKVIQRSMPKQRGSDGKNKRISWQYIAFVEGQPKRGNMPHFHIISASKSPKRLKDVAMYAGFGYQASETRVSSKKASWYVSKYASKQHDKMPRNFRRVRTSTGFPDLPVSEFDKYIVKSVNETNSQYLMRVAEITGENIDSLREKWLDALNWNDEV